MTLHDWASLAVQTVTFGLLVAVIVKLKRQS